MLIIRRAVIVVLLLAGCATTAGYEQVLKSWNGQDINKLVQAWGPPSNEYRMPNGDTMYTWLNVGGTVVTASQYAGIATSTAVTYWCKTTFTVNPYGSIQSWRWEGNRCRA